MLEFNRRCSSVPWSVRSSSRHSGHRYTLTTTDPRISCKNTPTPKYGEWRNLAPLRISKLLYLPLLVPVMVKLELVVPTYQKSWKPYIHSLKTITKTLLHIEWRALTPKQLEKSAMGLWQRHNDWRHKACFDGPAYPKKKAIYLPGPQKYVK